MTTEIQQVLLCRCGACSHWEVIQRDGKFFLLCMTCDKEFEVVLHVPKSDHLEWAGIDSKKKKWSVHHEQNA